MLCNTLVLPVRYLLLLALAVHLAISVVILATEKTNYSISAGNSQKSAEKSTALSIHQYSYSFGENKLLDDASNIILVTTLDGAVHALDKRTGSLVWQLDGRCEPLVSSYRYSRDRIVGINSVQDDLVYLPEPYGNGSLYIYMPGKVIQKLPISIKQLVQSSPFRALDGTVYLGYMTTKLIKVNLHNGKIMHEYNEDERVGRLHPQTNIKSQDTIFLGRVDYHLSIYDPQSSNYHWNISFSEFTAVNIQDELIKNRNSHSNLQYNDTNQIIFGHRGDIVLSDIDSNILWSRKFGSPVVGAFGLRPDNQPYSDFSKNNYHLCPYRVYQPTKTPFSAQERQLPQSAYVGSNNNSLFVLSSSRFPLLTDAPSDYSNGYVSSTAISVGNDSLSLDSMRLTRVATSVRSHAKIHSPNGVDNRMGLMVAYSQDIHNSCTFSGDPSLVCLKYITINDDIWANIAHRQKLYKILNEIQNEEKAETNVRIAQQISGTIGNAPVTARMGFGFGVVATLITSIIGLDIYQRIKQCSDRIPKEKGRISNEKIEKISDTSKALTTVEERNSQTKEVESKDSQSDTGNVGTVIVVDFDRMLEDGGKQEWSTLGPKSTLYGTEFALPSPTIQSDGTTRINRLVLSDNVLGYGSHGTVVYRGVFEGREVAVKRLLLDFFDIAHHETSLLLQSDDHRNVIRYYCKEQCDRFLYIALELCDYSLADVIEPTSHSPPIAVDIVKLLVPQRIAHQILVGLHHLHQLNIVHRDLKPQNILLITKQRQTDYFTSTRVLISDFGLCKKLEHDQSSFGHTTTHQGGTFGWRAPEVLAHSAASITHSSHSSSSSLNSLRTQSTTDETKAKPSCRITKAIDIFALGCLFYYILTGGDHPFGDRYSREINILKGEHNLERLQGLDLDNILALDMIQHMIYPEPAMRPSTGALLLYPYFWTTSQRLAFLQDVSDRFEVEVRVPPSQFLTALEIDSSTVVGGDWTFLIDRAVAHNLGKFRKYQGQSVQDLLRAMRNKKHHYQDLPPHVRKILGEVPYGFLNYFTSRFPKLFLHVYYVVYNEPVLRNDPLLRRYFQDQTGLR